MFYIHCIVFYMGTYSSTIPMHLEVPFLETYLRGGIPIDIIWWYI